MTPETMQAVLLTGFGGPEKLEYRTDVPVPRPGEGEVLVKVGAAGINNTDLWTREGAQGLFPNSFLLRSALFSACYVVRP